MSVRVRLLKWQGPVVPERTTEPPRIACLDVPATHPYAGIHENVVQHWQDGSPIRTTGFMNELCAPYAEESDADRMEARP